VTIAVISILFVAVAAGLTTSVKAGAATDQQQRLQAKLTSFTEGLRSLKAEYVGCGVPPDQATAWNTKYDEVVALPATTALQERADLGASVIEVRYWNGAAYGVSCPVDALGHVDDQGSQLLTVEVTEGDRVVRGQVVVRTTT